MKLFNYLKNPCNLYILVAFLYRCQGVLFPAAGIISRGFLLLTFILSIIYTIKVNNSYRLNLYLRKLNILVLFFTITGLFYLLFGNSLDDSSLGISRYTYLTNNLTSLLPIYPLYLFSIQGRLTKGKIESWFIPFLMCAIGRFFFEQQVALQKMMDTTGGYVEETTNNAGYIFCCLFPILFFMDKKKVLQYVSLAIILIFIVAAMKRGAILLAVLSVLWFLKRSLKELNKLGRIYLFILTLLSSLAVYKVVDDLMTNRVFFQTRIESTLEGKSSGRDSLYEGALEVYQEKFTMFDKLFGMGPNSTYTLIGNRAHNDWLELLLNHGLIGVTVYFLYWLSLFVVWRRCKKNSLIYSALGSFIIVFFFKTFFSMSYDAMELYSTIVLSWCIAQYDLSRARRFNGNTK